MVLIGNGRMITWEEKTPYLNDGCVAVVHNGIIENYLELKKGLVERGHEPDLCTVDPGFDVDLYVSTDLRTLTEVWLGYSDWARALHSGALRLTGTPERAAQLRAWLPGSAFAAVVKQAA